MAVPTMKPRPTAMPKLMGMPQGGHPNDQNNDTSNANRVQSQKIIHKTLAQSLYRKGENRKRKTLLLTQPLERTRGKQGMDGPTRRSDSTQRNNLCTQPARYLRKQRKITPP